MKEAKKDIIATILAGIFVISTVGLAIWGIINAVNSSPETSILSTDSSQKNSTPTTTPTTTPTPTQTPTQTPTNYTLTNNGDQGINVKLKTKNPLEINFPTTLSKPVSVLLAKNRTIKITQLKGEEFTLLPKEQTIKTDKNYKLLDIIKKDPLLVSYISKNNNLAFYTYQRIEDKNKRTLFKNWILFNTPSPTQTLNYRIDNAVVNIDSSGDAQVYFDTGKGKVSKISDFTIPKPYFLDRDTKRTNLNWKFNKSSHILSVTLSATPEQYPIALDPSVEKTDEVIATFSGKRVHMSHWCDSDANWDCTNEYVCSNDLSGSGYIVVAKEDASTTMKWKTSNTDCDTPQCGQDGGQDGDNLVADNTVDFSAYPARDYCKSIGGRMPTVTELQCIYNNRVTFGDNFIVGGHYLSAAERNSTDANNVVFSDSSTHSTYKTTSYYVRCVKGW